MAHNKNAPTENYPLEFPSDAITFDAEKLDELVRSQGVKLVHFRAMRCPVGLVDANDIRRPHDHHENCSHGFLYKKVGTVTSLFLGNSLNRNKQDVGLLNDSTAQVTFPRFYDDSQDAQVSVLYYDRFYLDEESITVDTWESFNSSETDKERLKYPVVKVNWIVDSRGIEYKQGEDFEVRNGQIVWTARRPGIESATGHGRVVSVHYQYRPYFYCKQMTHQLRIAQQEDDYGNRRSERLNQAAILQREYIFETEERDPEAPNPDSPRQVPGPDDGGFGAR